MKTARTKLNEAFDRLSPSAQKAVRIGLSIVLGMAAALVLSYVVYRTSLPSKPFIYVAF